MEQRVRVLIVDDQRSSRQALEAFLSSFSQIEVVGSATCGHEAIELVSQSEPDVVLMDIHLPAIDGMDGLEATKCIKTRWPAIRVIALTNYPSFRFEALAAGADLFLLKGCPANTLRDAVIHPN